MKNLSIGRLFVYILLFLTIVQYISLLFKNKPADSDFRSFYSALRIFVSRPENLYDREIQHQLQSQFYVFPDTLSFEFLPYLNPPFYLVPFLPFYFLSKTAAYPGIMFLMFTVMGLNLYLLILFFKSKKDLLAKILVSISFAPVFLTLKQTQNSFISLFVFILVYYFLKIKKYFAAGLVISLLLFKPQLLFVLIVYSLAVKNKKLILGILSGISVLTLVSTLILKGNWASYFSLWNWYLNYHEFITPENVYVLSIYGFFNQLFTLVHGFSPLLFSALSGLVILLYILPHFKSVKPGSKLFGKLFSLIIITTLLIGFHVNLHDAVLTLFPLFVYWQDKNSLKFYLLTAAGWLILLLAYFSPFYPKPLYFLPTLYFLYLYWLILSDISRTNISKYLGK